MINQTCQVCNKEEADCIAMKPYTEWVFICTNCQNNKAGYWYWIDFDRLNNEDDWLRHLDGKVWFKDNYDLRQSFIKIRDYIIKHNKKDELDSKEGD